MSPRSTICLCRNFRFCGVCAHASFTRLINPLVSLSLVTSSVYLIHYDNVGSPTASLILFLCLDVLIDTCRAPTGYKYMRIGVDISRDSHPSYRGPSYSNTPPQP